MYSTYGKEHIKIRSKQGHEDIAADLKTIYQAVTEKAGREALDKVAEKWKAKYPNAMKRWYDNWDCISPIFKFSAT